MLPKNKTKGTINQYIQTVQNVKTCVCSAFIRIYMHKFQYISIYSEKAFLLLTPRPCAPLLAIEKRI